VTGWRNRIGIGVLTKVFTPELVVRVVERAGVRERRERTLSAPVVYYLLAMVPFFQSGCSEVWNKLVAGLNWAHRFRPRMLLACSRAGLRLATSAADGMCLDRPTPLRTPPSSATQATTQAAAHSRRSGSRARECGTRAVLGAELPPPATGEALLRQLLARLRPGDLLLADRNYLCHGLLADVLAAGVHVLWRAKSDVELPVLKSWPTARTGRGSPIRTRPRTSAVRARHQVASPASQCR
jgi:hypothetical protein